MKTFIFFDELFCQMVKYIIKMSDFIRDFEKNLPEKVLQENS